MAVGWVTRGTHNLAWLAAGAVAAFGVTALALALFPTARVANVDTTSIPDQSPSSEAATLATAYEDGTWPPVFGEIAAATPSPAQDDTLAENTQWSLRGMVVDGDDGWAIIAGDAGDVLVSVGSEPAPGQRVAAITVAGVEIATGDNRTLVAFDDAATLTAAEDNDDIVAPDRPPRVLTATLPLDEVREVGLQRMMGLAGGVQIIELADGRRAQEIIWVRNGRLYDRVGLRPGDIIVSINDVPAGDADMLVQAVPSLVRERSFVLAVLRDNEQLNLEISVE